MTTTALIRANGTFDRAAIKSVVASHVGAQREWLRRWSGDALAFWKRRIFQNAVDNALREARCQRAAFVTAAAKIKFTAKEAAELDRLAARADACPITFAGNALCEELRARAAAIREGAERAAYALVEASITRAARAATRRAA